MRTTLTVLVGLTVCLVAEPARSQDAPSPELTDAEFADLLALHDEAHDTLMGLITGLTDEQWNFHENPDRWSIGEIVEHITRSEAGMLENVKGIVAQEPDPEWADKTEGKLPVLRQLVPNPMPQGQGGVRAPVELRPTEEWDRAEGIEQFYTVQGEVRAFIETMDPEIKNRTMQSGIPQLGWMNAHDWLNLLLLHVLRHSKQIEKVKAHPDYPQAPEMANAPDPNPYMTGEEFAALVKAIDDAQDRLLGLMAGMSDEQWRFRENPDRWSVAECVEHIARTERAILNGIDFAFSGAPNPNWHEETSGKTERVKQIAVNRPKGGVGSPFRAPGEVAPSENWDRATAFKTFYASHGAFRAYVETMDRKIKDRTFENPFPELGTLNGYDWLTLAAHHIFRHAQQIEEVQADKNYPS